MQHRPRLSVQSPCLAAHLAVEIAGQDFEHLTKVMRKKVGDEIIIFNGRDGDWLSEIAAVNKKSLVLLIKSQLRKQDTPSNVTLAFALVKNIEAVATKATEMGVGRFIPLITDHCVVNKINRERFEANIKEACEQCERNDIPKLSDLVRLDELLTRSSDEGRRAGDDESSPSQALIVCDESGGGKTAHELFADRDLKQARELIILIGPEGGFSQKELAKFEKYFRLSLGKNILRVDTAIIAALALINEFC